MSFAFFAGYALKVVHLGCGNWRADKANVVNLCHIAAGLVVLHKDLYVLYILEFYIAQIDGITTFQLLLGNATGNHNLSHSYIL